MSWLAGQGARVSVPLFHSPDYDLIADVDGRLLRVQVKTCTCYRKARWDVFIATQGGNQSWSGLVKKHDPARCDYLFVLVGDGRRWFIPSELVEGGRGIRLGGPKYAQFEVEAGDPIPLETPFAVSSKLVARIPGGCPSG